MAPTLDGGQVALPVWASRSAEQLAAQQGASVLWTPDVDRLPHGPATQEGVGFAAASTAGSRAQFPRRVRRRRALVELLELLAGPAPPCPP